MWDFGHALSGLEVFEITLRNLYSEIGQPIWVFFHSIVWKVVNRFVRPALHFNVRRHGALWRMVGIIDRLDQNLAKIIGRKMVVDTRFELVTPAMSMQCSTTELIDHPI